MLIAQSNTNNKLLHAQHDGTYINAVQSRDSSPSTALSAPSTSDPVTHHSTSLTSFTTLRQRADRDDLRHPGVVHQCVASADRVAVLDKMRRRAPEASTPKGGQYRSYCEPHHNQRAIPLYSRRVLTSLFGDVTTLRAVTIQQLRVQGEQRFAEKVGARPTSTGCLDHLRLLPLTSLPSSVLYCCAIRARY